MPVSISVGSPALGIQRELLPTDPEFMLFDTTFVGRSSEDALAFIVEILQSSTEYSFIGKGLDGKILLWNEGARRLYGYEAEEVLGAVTAEILHAPEDIVAGLPT